jgi:hypothetical protein
MNAVKLLKSTHFSDLVELSEEALLNPSAKLATLARVTIQRA